MQEFVFLKRGAKKSAVFSEAQPERPWDLFWHMSDKEKRPQGPVLDKEKGSKDKAWWQPALILFFRFSSWIAFPVLVGALIGDWADNKYNSGKSFYIFFIIGASFFISMFGLVREATREFKRIEKEEAEKKLNTKEADGKTEK